MMNADSSKLVSELRQWASLIGTEPRGARDLFNRAADAIEQMIPEPPTDDEREAIAKAICEAVENGDGETPYDLAAADAVLASAPWRNRHRGPITDEGGQK